MKKGTLILFLLITTIFVNGQFNNEIVIQGNGWGGNPEVVDLDSDGDMDIILPRAIPNDGRVYLYQNDGVGNFSGTIQIITGIADAISYVFAGDMNNDLDIDLITYIAGTREIVWFENLGGISFGPANVIDTALTGTSRYVIHAPHDINGDGLLDIMFSRGSDLGWYQNLGGGNFSSTYTQISAPTDLGLVAYANGVDLDNDGDIDVYGGAEGVTPGVFCYENLGNGNFSTMNYLGGSVLGTATRMEVGDMDGDGDIDIVLCPGLLGGDIRIFENLGGFNFATGINPINDSQDFALDLSDIDSDGDLDILAGHTPFTDEKSVWYENLGGFNFSSANVITTLNYAGDLEFISGIDIDGDGDNDVVSLINPTSGILSLVWQENEKYSNVQVKGRLYADLNQNNSYDSTIDIGLSQLAVLSSPQSDFTFTYNDGSYITNFSDTLGSYQIFPQNLQYWSIVTDSLLYNINVDTIFYLRDSLDFGFYPDTILTDINVDIVGGFPKCKSNVNYWVDVRNQGTTIPNGLVEIVLDDSVGFIGSNITPDSIIGQKIYWNFDSLAYFSNEQINLFVQMPGVLNIGNSLTSYVNVNAFDSLGTPAGVFSDTLSQVLTCAYDPNDKIATPSGTDSLGFIFPAPDFIEYTIRFQNTGNDTAINITIEDQLDSNLLWQTLTPISSSDEVIINVDQCGEVLFRFNNIMLPDSGVNFLGSQGYVRYKINLKPNLAYGTQIFNTAHIYFDLNPAVITNTKIHTISWPTGILEFEKINSNIEMNIYPNPFNDFTTIEFKKALSSEYDMYVYDVIGKEIYAQKRLKGNKFILKRSDLGKGIYLINLVNNQTGEKVTRKIISQ